MDIFVFEMSKTTTTKVKISDEVFHVKVNLTDQETLDREGNITCGVEITFFPEDAERLSKVMGGIKPGEFSVGFNPDYVGFKKEI